MRKKIMWRFVSQQCDVKYYFVHMLILQDGQKCVHINNTRNFFEQHVNMYHSIVSSAYRSSPPSNLVAVTLARQLEGVLADPSGAAGASLGLVETLAVAKTSMLLTGRGETSAVTPLVGRITYPVHTRIISDLVLGYINQDDLEILVGGVLGNPVAVQHSQALQPVTNTLLSNGLQVSVWLLF